MTENRPEGIPVPPVWFDELLALLSIILQAHGATLSVYTSRKQRTWVTFRSYLPHIYSTACEVRKDNELISLLDALLVAGVGHLWKIDLQEPQQDSWLPASDLGSVPEEARAVLDGYLRGTVHLPLADDAAPATTGKPVKGAIPKDKDADSSGRA